MLEPQTLSRVRFFYAALLAGLLSIAVGCAPLPVSNDAELLREQLMARFDSCISAQEAVASQVAKQTTLLESQSTALSELASSRKQTSNTVSSAQGTTNPVVACPSSKVVSEKLVVGQLEKVWMPTLNLALSARIDTGAETASLDARGIELFERNGKRWVRFEIEHPRKGEPPLQLERKLSRMVGIVQSNSPDSERRPVVKLAITIGNVNQTAEFTLSNRSHLDYQVLIGRNILQDVMVVDVSQKNIAPFVKAEADVATAGAR